MKINGNNKKATVLTFNLKSMDTRSWSFESSVVEPSLMIGGHPGGTVACTMAIVELENGRIIVTAPASIQFLDNEFDGYCWDEKGEQDG